MKDVNGIPKLSKITGNIPNSPEVDNGVLKFIDLNQLNNYLDYLDSIQTNFSQSGDSVDYDVVLDNIEHSYPGFTSFRKTELDSYFLGTDKGGEKDYNYESLDNNTILGYKNLKSVLNAQKEVYVGNDLIIYFDRENQIKVNDSLVGTVREVLSLNEPKEITFEKLEELEFLYKNNGIELMTMNKVLPSVDLSNGLFNTNVSFYPCTKEVEIRNVYSSLFSSGQGCYSYEKQPVINIDWGDGNQEVLNSTNTTYSAMWFVYKACELHYPARKIKQIYHPYSPSNNGICTLKISTPWHPTPKQYVLNFNDLGCTSNNKIKSESVYTNSGNNKLYGRIEVVNGFLTHRVIAESISYKKKSNGNWKKEKVNITTELKGDRKDEYCNVTSNIDKFENWNDSKTATIVSGNGAFNILYFSKLESKHSLTTNGEVLNLSLTLTSCN
ncbi:MAG TPA: hypothetical protein PKX92_04500 [Edaphocola sp.]|nr:hypothetical protein [Edaphocola sp.]